jgi:hypothetical protein
VISIIITVILIPQGRFEWTCIFAVDIKTYYKRSRTNFFPLGLYSSWNVLEWDIQVFQALELLEKDLSTGNSLKTPEIKYLA